MLIVVAAAAAAVLVSTNDGPPEEVGRRNEIRLLLAALSASGPVTVGFDATYSVTVDGETVSTSLNGAGRFVGPDQAHVTATIEPAEGDPVEVELLHVDGKRYLAVDGEAARGGKGSVLPGVAGSMLDGMRTIIELDKLASEIEMRGSGSEQFLDVVVDDQNAGLIEPPTLVTDIRVEFDAQDQPTAVTVSATGGEGDGVVQMNLNIVFLPATDESPIVLPPAASDGPGSALRYPVLAESLREIYGYAARIEVDAPASTTSLPAGQPTAPTTIPGG